MPVPQASSLRSRSFWPFLTRRLNCSPKPRMSSSGPSSRLSVVALWSTTTDGAVSSPATWRSRSAVRSTVAPLSASVNIRVNGARPTVSRRPPPLEDDAVVVLLDVERGWIRRRVDDDAETGAVVVEGGVPRGGEDQPQAAGLRSGDPQRVRRHVGRREADVGKVRHLGLDSLRLQRLAREPARHHAELDAGEGVDVEGDACVVGAHAPNAAEQYCGVGHGQPFTAPAVMPATK